MAKWKFYNFRGKSVRAAAGTPDAPEWLKRMAQAESRTVSGCVNHIVRMWFLKGEGMGYLTQEELEHGNREKSEG